jgi:hypothetical protein
VNILAYLIKVLKALGATDMKRELHKYCQKGPSFFVIIYKGQQIELG